MKAVIYARYSSYSQREESIEGQLRECRAFAEKNNIVVLGTYIDRAISARSDDRPDFQRMIKDADKEAFDTIIVWKLDRFARDRYDSAHYKALLKKHGVKVVSATEPISEDSSGILLEALLEGMAEYYSVELAEKVIRGMTENVLKGLYNGGSVPLGYVIDESRHFAVDPLTAPLVVEIFKMYDKGIRLKPISEYLFDRGIRDNKGKPVHVTFVNRILHNRKYLGEYKFANTVSEGVIPPIVPRKLFDSVQLKFERNMRAPARKLGVDDEKYLLTTKLFCGHCNVYMAGESGTSSTGAIYRYYKCGNQKRGLGCKLKPLPKEVIENYVVNLTLELLSDESTLSAIADYLVVAQGEMASDLPLLEKQLADAERGIDNMLNAIQEGVLTSSTKERLEALEEQRDLLKASISKEQIRYRPLTREQIMFWLSSFRNLDKTIPEQRQRLIDTFINAIYVFDDRIVFTYNYKDGEKTVTLKDVLASGLTGVPRKKADSDRSSMKSLGVPRYKGTVLMTRGRDKRGRF